jgi:hypothetical protein
MIKSWSIRASAMAVLALGLTYTIHGGQLERRMHGYLAWFMFAWTLLAFVLPMLGRRFNGSASRLVVLASITGYLSCTLAYWIAIAINPLERSHNLANLSIEVVLFLLSIPFVALGGWIFTLLYAAFLLISWRVGSRAAGSQD